MPGAETCSTVLSILILTRNRKNELCRALRSCVECLLPPNSEFVIVDNASEDGTKEAVDLFFQHNTYDYHYYYLDENIGAAAGRNVGFAKTAGRYVYFMDDDAYIKGPKLLFFEEMINFLEEHQDIFGITTTIYDTELQGNRGLIISQKSCIGTHKKVFWFHCGSILVDKQRGYDQEFLFLHHVFKGMPELYPSLKSYFNRKYIVEMENLQVIHEPSSHTRPSRRAETIYHYTGGLHTKLIFYPSITYPVLYSMFFLRIVKHLGFGGVPEAFDKLVQINKNLIKETVPLRRLIDLVRDFGFIATF